MALDPRHPRFSRQFQVERVPKTDAVWSAKTASVWCAKPHRGWFAKTDAVCGANPHRDWFAKTDAVWCA